MPPKKHQSIHFYPENTLEKLGFLSIIELLKTYCLSNLGLQRISKEEFSINKQIIEEKCNQVVEYQLINFNSYNFPINNYIDITDIVSRLKIENAILNPEDLLNLSMLLETVKRIFRFFEKYTEDFPILSKIIEDLDDLTFVLDQLVVIVDKDANIKDTASKKLGEIRNEMTIKDGQITREFDKILKLCKQNGWSSDEGETIRNGERVIALQSKFKRRINGIIYDESSSGRITYILPENIMHLRNDFFELKQLEKREVFKILKQFSDQIRPYCSVLERYMEVLGAFDFIRAKSILANTMNASMPIIENSPKLLLNRAFHPLLYLKNQKLGKKTVPLDINLGEGFDILVISGPNAGGKSVCLKTVGLLQLMIQFGLLVPVDTNSQMGIFNQVFIDIGDDQSIQDELSTYSSHLKRMNYLLRNVDRKSLFLIDELGSGTDPQVGGYIAEVILNNIRNKNAKGIVTTHYSNLKKFASENERVSNGSMRFDSKNLNPTYELSIGEIGSSYAFEIVKKTGFLPSIIDQIETTISKDNQSLDKLIIDLQKEKDEIDLKIQNIKNLELNLKERIEADKIRKQEYSRLKNDLELKSKERAGAYLENLNKRFEKLVKDWKEKDDNQKQIQIKYIKEKIEEEKSNINKFKKKDKKIVKNNTTEKNIVAGNIVHLKDGKERGTVEKIIGSKAIVIFGNFKMEIETDNLVFVEDYSKDNSKVTLRLKENSDKQKFSTELDIRGFRKDDALKTTEDFVDYALLKRFKQLRIIHGKGNGVLRISIRELLKKYSFIKEIKSESEMLGGDGVTLIEIE